MHAMMLLKHKKQWQRCWGAALRVFAAMSGAIVA
jgi:hypothetical protein